MTTQVGSVTLANPVMTASGTAGHGDELARYVDLASLGAVVVKSLAAEPWPGNPAPRVHETQGGMLNSVGLQGPGVEAWLRDELPPLLATGATVVASIWGRTVEEYAAAAALLADAPAEVVAVEVNLQLPEPPPRPGHVRPAARHRGRGGRRHRGVRPAAVGQADADGRRPGADRRPRPATPGPRRSPWSTPRSAWPSTPTPAGCASAGAAAGSRARPSTRSRCAAVHDVHVALPDLPIVGVGGVTRGVDAVELIMAGASAVQVGTATFADPRSVGRVAADVATWCRRHGVAEVTELIGVARAR